jgi:hypothetical protein
MSASPSFWDRRPWLGALIFASVFVAVGAFLALTVGERPHYRESWPLVTQLPAGGRFITGTPWQEDPVSVAVRLRVSDSANRGLHHVETVLVNGTTGETLSRGTTSPPEGHVFLPVPARFDELLFAGKLEIEALVPGRATERVVAPVPKRGESATSIQIDGAGDARVHLVNEANESLPFLGTVFAAAAGLPPHPRSGGWPLVNGSATLGGIPEGAPLDIVVEVAGRVTVRVPFILRKHDDHPIVSVVAGPRLAQVTGRVLDGEGRPQPNTLVKVTLLLAEGTGEAAPTTLVMTDRDGGFATSLHPHPAAVLLLRVNEGGVVMPAAPLPPGSTRDLGDIALGPFPTLASGTIVAPAGQPATGAVISIQGLAGVHPGIGAFAEASVDAGGTFASTGPDPGGSFRVWARLGDAIGRSAAVHAGATDVTITLASGATLSGRLSDGSQVAGLRVLLFDAEHGDAAPLRSLVIAEAALGTAPGSFRFGPLPAGTYDVVIEHPTGTTTRVDEVVLVAGHEDEDPRLEAIAAPLPLRIPTEGDR